MTRLLLLASALLALAAAPALAAPSARTYTATFSGTQQSSWTFSETGTCTGDDFVEYPFNGQGSGSSTLSFRTPQSTTVVVSRVRNTKRWAFNYQTSPILASQKAKAPKVSGKRVGTHSWTCPNSVNGSGTAETKGCGDRTHFLTVHANLNLHGKPGELDVVATENGAGSGASWGDDCPYFPGLNWTEARGGNDDRSADIPGGGLLQVKKQVGTSALAKGRALTITGKRTVPYDQTRTEGPTTRKIKGETVLQWKLVLTPKRR
jgi:opacity protein-like surface antigen